MKQFLKISMAFLFLMLSNIIFGQPRDTVLNKYNGEENITALNSIKLTNGFHIKDGSVRIFISDFPQAPLSLNHSYNHVLLRTPRVAGVNRNNLYSTKPINEESLDVLYFDDLGRTIQQIRVAASPSFKDIVEHLEYDAYGRQDKNYMPYAENKENKGGYISEAKNQTFSFYKENSWDTHVSKTARPFSQTNFEDSPLNRVLEQGEVGEDWQPETGHASKISYGTNLNSGSEAVKLWRINQTDDGASVSGVYAEGTLLRITKRDENVPIGSRKGSIEEYYNFNNDVVVQRVWISESEFRGTYYIYDDYDDLRYVLPPTVNEDAKLSSGGIDSFLENESSYKHYIYGYKYDQRRRLIEKKTPGRGIQKYVYNAFEQLVLSQDSLLATQGKWNAFKYDVDGREILRGFYQDTRNRRQLQNVLDTVSSIQYEVRTSSELGYSMVVFPKTMDVHGVTYYDDYSFPGNKFGSSATQKVGVANVQGLPTGTLRKVIGDDNFLLSTYYYDKYGRNIRVVQEIHTGGTEISDTEYDFSGNVLSNTVSSKFSEGHATLQIKTRFKYDHVARLQNIYKKIGSGNEIILNQLDYNEIGQLKRKQLHSDDGGRSFLLGIDYEYNPRGWLTKISSPNFTEILKYQDGTHKQWNGNIANQLWGHSSAANNEFTYQYDSQNRLTEGKSTGIIMSEKISYDEIGNITELVRDNRTNTYNYEGNNLKKVTGHLNTQNYRYDGNGNTIFDGRNGFDYTYNYLDLPVEVKHGNILKLANVYDHEGNLLTKRLLENDIHSERNYIGSLEYLKIGESGPKLELIHTEEGVVQNNNGIYSYHYFLKDHLGNVRAVIDKHSSNVRILQRHNYYPYGKLAPTGNIAGTNNYLYNGKEYLPGLGSGTSSGLYDYGARYYDPEIARWGTIDPLAEADYSSTPYAYVNGNPIFYNDPTGMIANPYIENILTGEKKWIPDGEAIPLNWRYFASDWFDIAPVTVTATAKKIGSMQAYFDSEREIVKNEYRKRAPAGLFMGYPMSEINRLTIERIERTWSTNEFVYIPNIYDGGSFRYQTGAGALVDANWVIDLGVGGVTAAFKGIGRIAANEGVQYTKSSLKLGQEMHKAYKAGLADDITTFKEFTGIKGIRPDFVDFGTKTIYELKPFNPRQIQLGKKQLNNYKSIFEKEYPGTNWKTVLDYY